MLHVANPPQKSEPHLIIIFSILHSGTRMLANLYVPPYSITCHLLRVCVCVCNNSNNISLHAMAFGSKMDKPSSSQEGGVVGLNFHQSKEVLINDSNGSIYTVSERERDR